MTETFISILEKGRSGKLQPFLQALDGPQRKALAPTIKKLAKEYLAFRPGGNFTGGGQKASDAQKEILWIAAFVCCNRADFERIEISTWIHAGKALNMVIDWYRPDWFGDFINGLADRAFVPLFLQYDQLMKLAEKGYLRPGKELVVKVLPMAINELVEGKWEFRPERLLIFRVTLEEHLWWMFELESPINLIGGYRLNKEDEDTSWLGVLLKYSADGRIDRQRLLREALQASNRNFDKNLSGWFIGLFLELDPTDAEIISLQDILLSVLHAPHSKVLNAALQCLKKIAGEKALKGRAFLDLAPVLLSSDTKNIIAATLALLEKLARTDPALQAAICGVVTQVFINTDGQLQIRAAKIIDKYRAALDNSFRDLLVPYQTTLMSGVRSLLGDLVKAEEGDLVTGKAGRTGEDGLTGEMEGTGRGGLTGRTELRNGADAEEYPALPPVGDIDDLVFLASQAFDNNESWHIDWLPAMLIEWDHVLTGDAIGRLEPALQRALKLVKEEYGSNAGRLDHMLAIFFIDVCICLVRRSPAEAGVLRDLFGNFDQKGGEKIRRYLAIGEGKSYLADWAASNTEPFYKPYLRLLLTALDKIWQKDRLPMLSTPTHAPGWIDPLRLVERLVLYDEAGRLPAEMDLQVAVSRCLCGGDEKREEMGAAGAAEEQDKVGMTRKAIDLAGSRLSGELRSLMLFLLGADGQDQPAGPFLHGGAWFCAVLARREKKMPLALENGASFQKPFVNYTGQFGWESVTEEYQYNEYDHVKKKMVAMTGQRKKLRIDFGTRQPPIVKEASGVQKWVSRIFPKASKVASLLEPPPAFLYDFFTIRSTYMVGNEGNDIRRILLLAPHNPEPFLAGIIGLCLHSPASTGEAYKKIVVSALQLLYEIWEDGGEMTYLFLGTCLLSPDKTAANIAAEIWLKAGAAGKMDHVRLGKIIGNHERVEFAPLKRLTDLMTQKLFLVSPFYNARLQILIEHILVELPEVPVKGLKKLLEIYAELVDGVGAPGVGAGKKGADGIDAGSGGVNAGPDGVLPDKLKIWKETEGLQKIVGRVLAD